MRKYAKYKKYAKGGANSSQGGVKNKTEGPSAPKPRPGRPCPPAKHLARAFCLKPVTCCSLHKNENP